MSNTIMANPISVRLDGQNQQNLDRFAKMTKRSRSFIVNEAVQAYMKDRIQYLEELNEAVEDAQSGYGHSKDQIHAWMHSWGVEDEIASPTSDIAPHK
jgi:predicted transcriptional regulator